MSETESGSNSRLSPDGPNAPQPGTQSQITLHQPNIQEHASDRRQPRSASASYHDTLAYLQQFNLPCFYRDYYAVLDMSPNQDPPADLPDSNWIHDVVNRANSLDISLKLGYVPIDILNMLLHCPGKWERMTLNASPIGLERDCFRAFCQTIPLASRLTTLTLTHEGMKPHNCRIGNPRLPIRAASQPELRSLKYLYLTGIPVTSLRIRFPSLVAFQASSIEFWTRELKHVFEMSCGKIEAIGLRDTAATIHSASGDSFVLDYASSQLSEVQIGGVYQNDLPVYSRPIPLASLFGNFPNLIVLVVSTSNLPSPPWPFFPQLQHLTLRVDGADSPSFQPWYDANDHSLVRGWWLSMVWLRTVKFEIPEKAVACFHQPRCQGLWGLTSKCQNCSKARERVNMFLNVLVNSFVTPPWTGQQDVCPRLATMGFEMTSAVQFSEAVILSILAVASQRKNPPIPAQYLPPAEVPMSPCGFTVDIRRLPDADPDRRFENVYFPAVVDAFKNLLAQQSEEDTASFWNIITTEAELRPVVQGSAPSIISPPPPSGQNVGNAPQIGVVPGPSQTGQQPHLARGPSRAPVAQGRENGHRRATPAPQPELVPADILADIFALSDLDTPMPPLILPPIPPLRPWPGPTVVRVVQRVGNVIHRDATQMPLQNLQPQLIRGPLPHIAAQSTAGFGAPGAMVRGPPQNTLPPLTHGNASQPGIANRNIPNIPSLAQTIRGLPPTAAAQTRGNISQAGVAQLPPQNVLPPLRGPMPTAAVQRPGGAHQQGVAHRQALNISPPAPTTGGPSGGQPRNTPAQRSVSTTIRQEPADGLGRGVVHTLPQNVPRRQLRERLAAAAAIAAEDAAQSSEHLPERG